VAVPYAPDAAHNVVAFVHTRELRQIQTRLAEARTGTELVVWNVDDEVTYGDYDAKIVDINENGTYELAYDTGGRVDDVDRGMLMRRESVTESRFRRKRPAVQRNQDKHAATEYSHAKTESLQNDKRAKSITFALLSESIDPTNAGDEVAVAVQVMCEEPDGSLRLVPAPNGNANREPEYIQVGDIIKEMAVEEKTKLKTEHFASWVVDLCWQAEVVMEEKKRVRIARLAA
jgi:hypothetical protein